MVRALGGVGDPATRLENRLGEPAANPYLFIASQIVAGGDGIAGKTEPGPQDADAYTAKRAMLPTRLSEALDALDKDALFRRRFGGTFIDYYLRLKGNEALRFGQFLEQHNLTGMPEQPTEWEQNEYFDFF
jgi:glutamine synthetase